MDRVFWSVKKIVLNLKFLLKLFYSIDSVQKPKSPVPIPFPLGRFIDDPSFQHEDFNGSSAGTLRARVNIIVERGGERG